MLLQAIVRTGRHVLEAVDRRGDHHVEQLIVRCISVGLLMLYVLSEHDAQGFVIACWHAYPARAAQHARLGSVLHPFLLVCAAPPAASPPLPDTIVGRTGQIRKGRGT